MGHTSVLALPAAFLSAAVLACQSPTASKAGVPASILVTPDTVRLVQGQSRLLAVSVFDGNGTLLIGVTVSFASSDATVVTVSSAGLVRAIATSGQATLKVTCGTASTTVRVVLVVAVPTSVTVSPPSVALRVGDSVPLTATVYDQAGQILAGAAVTFASADTSVATVSTSGVVSGVALGSTSVTASGGAARAAVPVHVISNDAVTAAIPVPGGAYGIDVSGSGVVYVTLLTTPHLARVSLATLAVVDTIAVGSVPTGVAFSPDGAYAYVTNQYSGTLSVVRVAEDRQIAVVALGNSPFVVRASPTGATVAATDNVGNLYFVSTGTDSVIATLAVGGAPNGLAYNTGGTRLYVSTSTGGTVVEVDPTIPRVLRTITTGGTPQGIDVSGDGTELYVANEAGWLGVYRIATAARLDSIPLDAGAFALARSPDDSVLYVGIPRLGEVEIVRRSARVVTGTLLVGGTPRRIAFTADARHAVVADEQGWVHVVTR